MASILAPSTARCQRGQGGQSALPSATEVSRVAHDQSLLNRRMEVLLATLWKTSSHVAQLLATATATLQNGQVGRHAPWLATVVSRKDTGMWPSPLVVLVNARQTIRGTGTRRPRAMRHGAIHP